MSRNGLLLVFVVTLFLSSLTKIEKASAAGCPKENPTTTFPFMKDKRCLQDFGGGRVAYTSKVTGEVVGHTPGGVPLVRVNPPRKEGLDGNPAKLGDTSDSTNFRYEAAVSGGPNGNGPGEIVTTCVYKTPAGNYYWGSANCEKEHLYLIAYPPTFYSPAVNRLTVYWPSPAVAKAAGF